MRPILYGFHPEKTREKNCCNRSNVLILQPFFDEQHAGNHLTKA